MCGGAFVFAEGVLYAQGVICEDVLKASREVYICGEQSLMAFPVDRKQGHLYAHLYENHA